MAHTDYSNEPIGTALPSPPLLQPDAPKSQQSFKNLYNQLSRLFRRRATRKGNELGQEGDTIDRGVEKSENGGFAEQKSGRRVRGGDSDRRKVENALAVDPRFSKLMSIETELKQLCQGSSIGINKTAKQYKSSVLKISLKHNSSATAASTKATKKQPLRPPTFSHSHKNTKSKYSLHPLQQTSILFGKEMMFSQNNFKSTRSSFKYLQSARNKNKVKSKQSIPCDLTVSRGKVDVQNKTLDPSIETNQTAPTPPQPSIKQIQQSLSIPEEQPPKKVKKGVRFDVSSDSDLQSFKSIAGLTSNLEENIITLLIEERFEDVLDQIKKAEDHLQDMEGEDKQYALSFTLKLSRWCRQAGKERYATLLLKRVLPRHEEDSRHKLMLLKELSRNYEDLKEYKSAIEVSNELVKLGEWQYLDRLGEIHMMRENYTQSLKCYEKYHEVRGDTYSLVKLAHASSKIPSYSKRAIEMLNDILFENKTSCIFKDHTPDEAEDFQSALLLLVTIYMNLNGHKKAMEICEKYLKKDFGAYPIFYILGVLKLRDNHREQAFSCFLSAIRLKPNHLPSLIELLKFLATNSSEVLGVLRKAFLRHHRDWELLQLLVEAATKTKVKHSELSVQGLIHCAKLLEGVCEEQHMSMQIEAVWLWAAEMIDERQRRVSVVDQEYVENVYVRLGEISLKKGNYAASERYFSRVLQKLQIEGCRLRTLPKMHYLRLELQILRRLAYLKSEQKDQDAAMKLLQQSRDNAVRYGLPMQAISDGEKIGKILFMTERYEQAVRQFQKGCVIVQEMPFGLQQQKNWEKWKEMQLKIGDCYQNMHKWKEARRTYQGILKHRICEEAVKSLANLYAWQGSPELAKELLDSLKVLNL